MGAFEGGKGAGDASAAEPQTDDRAPELDQGPEPVWSLQPGAFLLYLIAGVSYVVVGVFVPEILLSLLYGYAVVIVATWAAPTLIRRAWRRARRS